MVKSKYIFEEFGEELKKEKEVFKAHSEAKEIRFNKCTHKSVRFEKEELKCSCGAFWTGHSLDKIYRHFTS